MSRLHLRFYFTVLGCLLAFALILLVLWHLNGGGPISHRMSTLMALPVVAIVVSIAAYPITRQLTRRLERLEFAVELLGEGKLASRVKVEGNDEVARLAVSFNRAASRIEELVGVHKTLLANASHELRTPLTRIRLSVDLIKNLADHQSKAGLEQDIAELDHLIDEILLASRLDATVEAAVEEEVDLLGLAAEECSRYDGVQFGGTPVVIVGDTRLLRRLLRNLLDNAERYGAPPVEVCISDSFGVAQIAVYDRGRPIPDFESERLFEPFYRRANAANHSGAGLGLALVSQIAERHGGRAYLVATADGRNCFRVDLPLSRYRATAQNERA
ncbi:HAMP domain-containing sensor histidine kinase [Dyella jiangningensis]|jgi:signal transduction histidine kinase|uniref:sensor histidine kinase n=1 Tax=Dyella jiangningensis TaxID=1379159 RepID=UPI002410AECE|nr:HAMP domain-containing sensor histidine kinase [Dyella jiangningensis]MDG2537814.1 HAMP domain-containing sensor histidine kinase [Dyella jiangningensis]